MAPSCNHWRGRHRNTQEEVVQCDAEVEVHQSRWQALVDADGCFVEWISPRIDCEGQRWKVILPEKPTTLTKAHSGQETKALQPSTTSTVHGRRFLFRSQKRLQTKFGRGRLCNCKPIGQKPTTQIKHTPVFDTTYLSTRKYRTAFHFTSPWYQRQMHPPSPQETDGTPWHGWPGQN